MRIEIDGGMGEGGGQVLRTALTLSMCTGRPVVVDDIRAARAKPGLMRQHLAAVRAAQAISGAEVEGAELGSRRVVFEPTGIKAGDYGFPIGSAGSTTLLLQTILPALARAPRPSTVYLHGGTHNQLAPSVDFVEQAFLPVLSRMGLPVESRLDRHGFYPNGGGKWRVVVPVWSRPQPLRLLERGVHVANRAVVKLSNLQRHIAERELERVSRKLGWPQEQLVVEEVSGAGPGNILSLRCTYEHAVGVFESVGSLGVTAEQVAGRAIRDAKRYVAEPHPVCEHLADQLLVPMVLGAGGEFRTGSLSSHTRTNIRVIEQMLGQGLIDVREDATCGGTHVRIRSGPA